MQHSGHSNRIKWVRTLWGLEARWTVEPDEAAVMTTIQAAIALPDPCEIKFLAQGAFNKIFTLASGDKQVVARITLPIDPKWKTLSEVATLEWVRTNNSLPVPRVLAYDAEGSNTPVGFEWITVEMISGKPWADAYRSMTFSTKEEVIRRIARFTSEAFHKPLRDFAELDCSGRLEKVQKSINQDQNGLNAVIDTEEIQEGHDNEDAGAKRRDDKDVGEDDKDDIDVLEDALKIIQKLKVHLREFFDPPGIEPEPTILFHDDLNRHNILVDEAGELTAVVEWECISAPPLWAACRYPSFIDGKPTMWNRSGSAIITMNMVKLTSCSGNTSKTFESTKLRRLFLREMQRLAPGWVETFEASQRQRDFDMALDSCDDEFSIRRILTWLAEIQLGKKDIVSLEARFV